MTGPVRPAPVPAQERLAATLASRRRALAADLIEQAALELFVARPMDDVTVEQIAAAAGVSVRSFYRYFATKEMIVAALPIRLTRDIAAATALRPEEEPPFVALRNGVDDLSQETNDYLRRWQRAMARSYANDRIAALVVSVTSPILAEALAARAGEEPTAPWSELAGVSAATALVVGSRRWSVERGSLRSHLLTALDILGGGLNEGPPRSAV